MPLGNYITLGRSGLRVSPLCLGTMTFGNAQWGCDEATSHALFDRYLEAGGNFVDTADLYSGGKSEEFLGRFIAQRKLRERVVIATKFGFNAEAGNPNAGGNGRKHIYHALEGSLRRLETDYLDLYYLHVWDLVTPLEEVLATLLDLVRAGKIRYFGFSDTPAWYLARLQTLAEVQGRDGAIAWQLEYSLLERHIEHEHIPAAQELGIAVCAWSPLSSGLLTGKYQRQQGPSENSQQKDWQGEGRFARQTLGGPVFDKFTERNWRIVDAVRQVAKQMGKTAAQIALNWVATQPGITAPILGATNRQQLEDNLAAIEFSIPAELRARLDETSALALAHPYMFFGTFMQSRINAGTAIRRWTPASVDYQTLGFESTAPAQPRPAEATRQKPKTSAADR
jgi:aryl-alcohol dehydrogenase-like predicted oxidoreductase